MKLPYYYKLRIESLPSAPQVEALLARHTLTDPGDSPKDDALRRAAVAGGADYLYRTVFDEAGFKIFQCYQKFGFTRSYLPLGSATYSRQDSYGTGCRLVLVFKAPLPIRIFMFIWGFGVVFGFSAIFFESLSQGNYRDALLTPLGISPFALGFWGIHKVGFQQDVDAYWKFLQQIGITGEQW